MRWFTKRSIKRIVQSFLLGYIVFAGFFLEYAWIWWRLGLPEDPWLVLVPTVLSILSTYGLFYWIARD